jgi:hypothetical protein
MVDGHSLCASSHVPELIRSRHAVKEMKEAVVEIVDDDARSVTRYEIRRHRPAYGDGWSSTGRGLEQDQSERIAACRYQQKVYGSVHRSEIVTVFVADKVGVRPREPRPLGPIANNDQPTAETLDRVSMIQDLREILLSCDSANEPEYNRISILIACRHRVGCRKPPNIDKRRGVKKLPFQHAAEALFRLARVRDEKAALSVNHPVPPIGDTSRQGDFQSGWDQGRQIFADVCGPIGVIKTDARLSISGGVPHR